MPEYSYRFANLLSDADVAELELSNVKFDRRIIVPSAFSATLTVTNNDIATLAKRIVPAKTVVHVYRDADIWGTYIIWNMRIKSAPRGPVVIEYQGASLESWFDRRIIDIDLNYTSTDQYSIARALVANAQVGWVPYPGAADLNITAGTNLSGVLRDRHYKLTEAATVGQRLQELANVDNGFEYFISTYVDESLDARVRKLVIAEELGLENGDFVYTYPGNIINYEITYDASDAGTAFWTRGGTAEEDLAEDAQPTMLSAPVLAEDWLASAFPHLDKVIDYSSVTVLATLTEYATWWRDNRAGVWAVPVIEVSTANSQTILSPTALGSYAQITIEDELFGLSDEGPEFSYNNRIVGIEVTPPERGKQESIRLVVEQSFDPTDIT